jgi:hypothetical protein
MWMVLSPDRLSKGEGGSCRGGRIKAEEVSSNIPTVVVDDDGQPGLGDLTVRTGIGFRRLGGDSLRAHLGQGLSFEDDARMVPILRGYVCFVGVSKGI